MSSLLFPNLENSGTSWQYNSCHRRFEKVEGSNPASVKLMRSRYHQWKVSHWTFSLKLNPYQEFVRCRIRHQWGWLKWLQEGGFFRRFIVKGHLLFYKRSYIRYYVFTYIRKRNERYCNRQTITRQNSKYRKWGSPIFCHWCRIVVSGNLNNPNVTIKTTYSIKYACNSE
jgi:hypothetical protein